MALPEVPGHVGAVPAESGAHDDTPDAPEKDEFIAPGAVMEYRPVPCVMIAE
jgi:hypothetical protein